MTTAANLLGRKQQLLERLHEMTSALTSATKSIV